MKNYISSVRKFICIIPLRILAIFVIPLILLSHRSQGQSTEQNYVRSATPRVAIPILQTLESNINNGNAVQTGYTYYDQQGRNIQTVGSHQSPSGNDVVQLIEYDLLGRQPKQWMPYSISNTSSSGSFRTNGATEAISFYSGTTNIPSTAVPFSSTLYDASTLNRPLEQGYPGEVWQVGSGHSTKTTYGVNANGEARLWTLNSSNNGASYTTYPAGTLTTLTVTDENGNSATQYKDYAGKLVSKKVQSGPSSFLTTDYVYDDAGNLQYVIPPLPSVPSQVTLPSSFTESDQVFLNFFYAYHYDGKNRLIEKKVPGKGWEFLIYNKIDQLILSQNPTQGILGVWLYNKYDANGRIVQTGEYTTTSSRNTLQNTVDGLNSSLYEFFNNSSSNFGYSDDSYPDNSLSGSKKVLITSYYDDYSFIGNSTLNPNPSAFTLPTADTIYKVPSGLLTGSLSNVLGTSNYLFNVLHYDTKGNPVRAITQTFAASATNANQYDIVENIYSFNNLLVRTTKNHYMSSGLQLTVVANMQYDLQGRQILLQQQYSTPSYTGPVINLANFDYNETGQLVKKALHLQDNGTASAANITLGQADAVTGSQQKNVVASNSIILSEGFHADAGSTFSARITNSYQQVIDYSYNTRGWLTKINDPNNFDGTRVFAEKLDYDLPNSNYAGSQAQYNGNISTASSQVLVKPGYGLTQETKGYVYQYDALNQLKSGSSRATSGNDKNSETLTYDELGNILTLNRTSGTGASQNALSYNYGSGTARGNQLLSIQNNGGSENYSGAYTYYASGNAMSDAPSGISQIRYNELGLPSIINFSSGKILTYYYDASGNKLEKIISNTSGVLEDRSYINGIEYLGNSIAFISTPEGRVIPGNNSFAFEYSIKDHLGNTRVIFGDKNNDNSFNASTDIVQETDYYPFGRQIATFEANPQFQYKYNGKEFISDLNSYDYGARFYNPIIARWSTVDNAAESSRRWNPYTYAYNNPARNIDPDGNFSYDYSTAIGNAQASSLSQISYNGINNGMQSSFEFGALADYNAGKSNYLPDSFNPVSNALRAGMFSQINEQYSAYTKGKGASDDYGSSYYGLNGGSGGNSGGLGNFLLHLTPFGGVIDFANAARNGDVGGAVLGLASTAAFFTGEGEVQTFNTMHTASSAESESYSILYRNFGWNEYQSIRNTGEFSIHPNSYAGKQFWFGDSGKQFWENSNFAKPFTVQISIPTSYITPGNSKYLFMETHPFIDNYPGGTIININNLGMFNSVMKINYFDFK